MANLNYTAREAMATAVEWNSRANERFIEQAMTAIEECSRLGQTNVLLVGGTYELKAAKEYLDTLGYETTIYKREETKEIDIRWVNA